MLNNLAKSVLHNLGVVGVGFVLARLGKWVDTRLSFPRFASFPTRVTGGLLLALGFAFRVWATVHFYDQRMRVISLQPQKTLLTSGPYAFSRNPLYLGGNVFIFLGAALFFGSPTALAATVAYLPLMDRMVRREERQLEQTFGDRWRSYQSRVRRWI